MTVDTSNRKIKYIGNGVTTNFTIPFPFFRVDSIKAQIKKKDSPVVPFFDFDISGINDDDEIGVYAITVEPIPLGAEIMFYRETALTQETDYKENANLSSETLERDFDNCVMQTQELSEELGRCLKLDMFDSRDSDITKILNACDEAVEGSKHYAESSNNSALAAQGENESAYGWATKSMEFASLSRSWAEGEPVDGESAKHWADEARETAYSVGNPANHDLSNLTETGEKKLVQPLSLYQDRIVLETSVIILQEKICRYERAVAVGDDFTIDVSGLNQQKNVTFELILKMPTAVSFSLGQILPLETGETADNNKKWMGGGAPDLSEPGEHWVAFTSHDGGGTWRASYEGLFLL